MNIKRLIFFSTLFLFCSMPASSVFYNPFEYPTDEEEKELADFYYPSMGYDDMNKQWDNSINTITPLGFGGGGGEDDFEEGAIYDNEGAYSDASLGNGFYALVYMVFMYIISLKVVRKRKL